jgi:uncharacterized membrane protein
MVVLARLAVLRLRSYAFAAIGTLIVGVFFRHYFRLDERMFLFASRRVGKESAVLSVSRARVALAVFASVVFVENVAT